MGLEDLFFILLKKFIESFGMEFLRKSYGQKGEDLALDKFSGNKRKGFYVDVGANDPHRFSNTKRFYLRGWTGINIEPDVDNWQKLSSQRKRDINLNFGIGESTSSLKLYKFIPHTLSTFSKEEADNYVGQGYKLEKIVLVEVKKLEDILAEYCKGDIDFMGIDTEGFDMQVLKSNNWNRFRPKLICIKSVSHTMRGLYNKKKDNHDNFLTNIGYRKVYDNGLNSIYKYEQ